VRMPAYELALSFIRAAGGVLAVTSANRSGLPPATNAAEVLEQLDGRIDAVVDGGPSPGGVASTVIRLREGRLEVLREGALAAADLLRVLDR
jgi:L-threonylcarbamoyladenylate synthase